VGSTVTWRGNAHGVWASSLNWSDFTLPGLADEVSIGGGDTVEITAGIVATAGALALPGGTLQLDAGGVLRVAGTIAVAGGTLDLAGTVTGGTLAPGGAVVGQGGTLEGTVVQGGLSGLGDLTITTATTTANAAQPIAPTGTLTLAGGLYNGETFALDPASAVGSVVGLAAGSGHGVVLGASSTVEGGGSTAVAGVVTVLGGGALANEGTIDVTPATQLQTQTVYQPTGKFHSLVGSSLTWTQSAAPTLDVAAVRFTNTGLLALTGGTLELTGASFRNSGSIRLTDATGQTPQQAADGLISVVAITLATHIEVAASVASFVNTGTISADSMQFDGAVRLPLLGTLAGALTFAGTLDLAGGTLDATAARAVTITGTVLHGTLGAGTGDLTLAGASLQGIILAAGTADATGTLDVLGVGGLTLDAGAVLQAGTSHGSVLLAGGSGAAIVNDGTIAAAAGATVALQAGLGGIGTVELGNDAAVTVGSVALFGKPTFLFDPGASLLALPGKGVGVTFADPHAGDVLDFLGISSTPAAAGSQGAAQETGSTLDVVGASGQTALVALSGPAHGISFSVTADSHGGTLVTVT